MPGDLSRLLNALGLILVDTVLALAFVDQLWFRDLPCPLCILQRLGFIAAGFGLALNMIFGPRPSHYGMTILGAATGAAISIRQILLHIVPGSGSYGNDILGLHLYTWAFIAFALMIIGSALLLLDDRQIRPHRTLVEQPQRVAVDGVYGVRRPRGRQCDLDAADLWRKPLPRCSDRVSGSLTGLSEAL